jgi:hypothetical protein
VVNSPSLLDLAAELEAVLHDQELPGASNPDACQRVERVALELRRRAASSPPAPLGLSLSKLAEVRAADASEDPARLAAEVRRLQARVSELEAQLAQASPNPGVPAPGPLP